jgi:multidrug efflux pump subunit AcrA (membrane-fusion protein)
VNIAFRFCVLICATLLVCCSRRTTGEEDEPATRSRVPVKVERISAGDIDVVVTATGKTDALRMEKIVSPVAGKVTMLSVLEGSAVRAGEVVAAIMTKESVAAIAGAEALLRAAKTPEERSEAERMLQLARSTRGSAEVRARFDGIVSARAAHEGELVAENADLLTVVDLSSLCFSADIPVGSVQQIRLGQRAVVRFPSLPGFSCRAVVEAMNPQTDEASQTVKARLRFTDRGARALSTLKTDMTGTADIVTGTHRGVLLVPKAALLRDDETNTFSIVTVTDDSLARAVAVVVDASNDSTVEISAPGLRQGMSVVVEGNYALPDSAKLNVVPR